MEKTTVGHTNKKVWLIVRPLPSAQMYPRPTHWTSRT